MCEYTQEMYNHDAHHPVPRPHPQTPPPPPLIGTIIMKTTEGVVYNDHIFNQGYHMTFNGLSRQSEVGMHSQFPQCLH